MGLLTKEVEIKLGVRTIKYYENLGYKIPREKDKWGNISVPRGTKIFVKTNDLTDSSHVKINIECDGCGKKLENIEWRDYKKCVKKDNKYYCQKCATELFGGLQKRLLDEKIKHIIDEKLGWIIIKIERIKGKTYVDLIDNEGYKYNNCLISDINNNKIPMRYYINNKYTKQNINYYCELNKLPMQLISDYNGNHKKLQWECLDCNNIFERSWCNIQSGQISCTYCGDGFSYGNKFVRSLLNQLNENYTSEYSPDWGYIKYDNPKLNGKKKYDNLLIDRNEIWEIHGLQHYEEINWSRYGGRTLKEEQENDNIKKELALNNGINNYIIIDCRKSESEWIKNSLIYSLKKHKYDLSKVDWNKCHELGCKSLVKVACNYWDSGIRNIKRIEEIMKLSKPTIIKYLKQGAKIGWCNYDANEEKEKHKKSIIQLDLNGNYIAEFKSIIEAGRKFNINSSNISTCCVGKQKTVSGYKWMYKEDYKKLTE